jgi:DNA ligase-1
MPDLQDGETAQVKGSGSSMYTLKNVGGVYSCNCPAWRNQSRPIERRTCKHLIAYRGEAQEQARLAGEYVPPPKYAGGAAEKKEGPPLLLAERWDTETNLAGWWMSEKLDGVRGYWDGKQLWSRLGNLIHAPDWFLEGLPEVPLDGELWIGRKQFNRTSGIVRRQDRPDVWREVRYVVFDAPQHDAAFEERLRFLEDLLGRRPPRFAALHPHSPCKGIDHLRAELARVEAVGGEGLMLREPGSRYLPGRNATLLKVKTFYDAEARVVGHDPGAGRHKGRLGALVVELSNGTRFSVGTGFSDAERERPTTIGSVITFRYQELSEARVPRFPSYVPPPPSVSEESEAVTVPVSVTPPAAAPPVAATAASAPRRFEYGLGPAARFWEVAQSGKEVRLRFGAAGTPGQNKTLTFPSEAAAHEAVEEMVAEKFDDGFVEHIPPTGAAPPPPPPAPAEEKPVKTAKAEKPAALPTAKPARKKPEPAAAAPTAAAAPAGPAGARRFEFVEGTSNKFWEVWVSGKEMTTRYGRIGSAGQMTVKAYPDEAGARAAMTKLIAEKTGKGYVEKSP